MQRYCVIAISSIETDFRVFGGTAFAWWKGDCVWWVSRIRVFVEGLEINSAPWFPRLFGAYDHLMAPCHGLAGSYRFNNAKFAVLV